MGLMQRMNESFGAFSKREDIPAYIKAPPLIASAWVFQGILNMDKTERYFKIMLDVVCILFFSCMLLGNWSAVNSIIVGFLLAHSLNFIFNSHPFVVAKNLGLTKTSRGRLTAFMKKMLDSAELNDSIKEVFIIGSFARSEATLASDIDLRIVRKEGWLNGIRACSWVTRERSRAVFARIPLDVFVLDSEILNRIRPGEQPVALSRTFLQSLSH